MNVEGLVNMRGNQIIVPAHCSRRISLRGDARLGQEAFDGCEIFGLLLLSESSPGLCQFSSGPGNETRPGTTNGLLASPHCLPFLTDNGVFALWLRRRFRAERDNPLEEEQKQQKWPSRAHGEGSWHGEVGAVADRYVATCKEKEQKKLSDDGAGDRGLDPKL